MNSRGEMHIVINSENITAKQTDMMLAYATKHISEYGADDGTILIPAGQYSHHFRDITYFFTLKHPLRYCGVLNPEAILPSQQEGLKALLARASIENALAPGKYIVAVTMDGRQELQLYELESIVSARKKFDDIDYYDVLDVSKKSLLGDGAYGKVYIVPGTIKPRFYNPNDMFFSPGHKTRIAKIQHHRWSAHSHTKKFSKLTRAKKEADLLRRSSSSMVRDLNVLRVKEEEAISIISMRRYVGNDLNDVLEYEISVREVLDIQLKLETIADELHKNNIANRVVLLDEYTATLKSLCRKIDEWVRRRSKLHPDLKSDLTVKDRIELSISLLREYQLGIQHNHILHRDLKPENIFLERNGLKLQPRIIDFGLSCDMSSKSQLSKTVGALLFRSPEAIDGPNTLKSDVYALMRVIALIWRDQELISYEKQFTAVTSFYTMRKHEININYDLFSGLDIDEKLKKMIESALRCGTLSDPNLRNDIAADIAAFEAIRAEFYMNNADPDVRAAIADAQKKALTLVDEMMVKTNDQSFDKIAEKIIKISETINQHPQSIDIFVKTLGVRALYGCHSAVEITNKIITIQSKYHAVYAEYMHRLVVLHREAKTMGIDSYRKYLDQCQVLADKLSSQATNLDAAYSITNHLVEKMVKINEAEQYYKKIMDEKDVDKTANRLKK